MQIEKVTSISDRKEAIKAGRIPGTPQYKEPEPEKEPHPQADFIAAMQEAGEIYSSGTIRHKKQDYDKWTKEKKIANCSRKGINFGIRKGFNGMAERIPRYCNNCPECYKANANSLKSRVGVAVNKVLEEKPDGEWRKKIVEPDKEAKALKKKISRNQDGCHLEISCIDNPDKTEIWCYVENESGKDMNRYGEVANPEDIDFDKLYELNRSTGKKMSMGKGFRRSGAGIVKKDTERVMLPDILIKDSTRQEEAESIIQNTNFIKEAKSTDEAKSLYIYQFKFILKELEKANIEIAAIKMNFFNMDKETILNDWNMNVQYWMSANSPLLKSSGSKVDISHLVYPKSSQGNGEPVVNYL